MTRSAYVDEHWNTCIPFKEPEAVSGSTLCSLDSMCMYVEGEYKLSGLAKKVTISKKSTFFVRT